MNPTNSPKKSLIQSGSMVLSVKQDIYKRYQKLSCIGQGAYGQVFKVQNIANGQLRALKVIDRRKTSVPLSGIGQEVDNMRRLDHPNIIRVYEISHDQDFIYIISELSNGNDLFHEIHSRLNTKNPFTEHEAASIIRQLLSALSQAHDRNIIHRDIKPENILMERTHLLIIDWGLSLCIPQDKMIRQRIGTVDYAAPEVLNGAYYDGRADIWSVGVIMYILLSGQTPFPGGTSGTIEAMIVSEQLKFTQKVWKTVSVEAMDLLKNMLQPNMNKRFRAQEALQHKWLTTLDKEININLEVMDRLKRFCCRNLLVQATSRFLFAESVEPEMQQELRQTFIALDTNHDGRLSLSELIKGVGSDRVKEIFDRIDTDSSGYIDYSEFLIASANLQKASQISSIRVAFELYDVDGDGYIDLSELKDILKPIDSTFCDDDWEVLLHEVDENGDGKISFDEYRRTIERFVEQKNGKYNSSIIGSLENENVELPIKKKVKTQVINKYNLRSQKNK